MYHDFGGQRGVVRRRQDCADVAVPQRVRGVAVARSVEEESRVDLFRRRWQQVQVAERPFVAEAAQLVVADHRIVASTSMPAAVGYSNDK